MSETYYVYCHDCKKLIYKGDHDTAIKKSCGKHGITFGRLDYIHSSYPELNTSNWGHGVLTEVIGDVTNPQVSSENEVAIIPHCCNDRGVMGAGVALALKRKWPPVESYYHHALRELKNNGEELLGTLSSYLISDNVVGPNQENPRVQAIVFNMIGQHNTRDSYNPKPVKYWALAQAMMSIKTYCLNIKETWDWYPDWDATPVIHTPKFGSDLAGGDWNIILELIKEIWIENGIDVVVYEFG
jgi:hypothetical protein